MSDARTGTPDAFALTSDPAAYVPSPDRERALAQMAAALAAGAVPCLEGPTGIGKTLLLQLLGQRVSDRFEALYMPYPMLSTSELCTFAVGLLERGFAADPEAALLRIVTEQAARGRPLLLLIDDAGSLPPETGRGLAALRADTRGSLYLALAGIESDALREATAPFGDTLMRVALDEGIPDKGLRDYVAAQLEHAGASARLREAFDDEVLEALGRAASGNPRRLHLAAQTFLRRAETGSSPEPVPVKPAADMEPPAPAPHAPPPGRPPPMPAAETPPTPARAAAPPPIREEPVARPPAARPRTEPAPPPPAEPIGEYRMVRSRQQAAEPTPPAREQAPRAPAAASVPRPQVDLTLAAASLPSEPAVAPVRPPWVEPEPAPRAARTRASGAPRRAPSIALVLGVAIVSAALGFMLASRLQHSGGESAPARPPSAASAAAPAPEPVREAKPPDPTPAPAATATLEPTPEPAAIPNPVPAAVAVPKPVPAAAAAPAPVEMIEISINATPWAIIEMDGRDLGETPLGGVSVARGTHRFVARFPDGRVVERSIPIDASRRAVVFE